MLDVSHHTLPPKRLPVALALASSLALSACAPSQTSDSPSAPVGDGAEDSSDGAAAPAEANTDPYQVGSIYSETGPLAAYGKQYKDGLEAGVAYATEGTGEVDGHPIELTYRDDAGTTS